MPDLPSGTVTFLFTDVQQSTRPRERDRATSAAAVERHLRSLREIVESNHGVLFNTVGNAGHAAFSTAPDAIAAALASQRSQAAVEGMDARRSLNVRVALHTVTAEPRDGLYLVPGLNRLAHLLEAGHGGQVLLFQSVRDLALDALPVDAALRDLGRHRLRDLLEPERVYQLLHPELPAEFPPLKSLNTQPNNLPLQPTPFLAREREVDQVAALLRQDDVHLLTLTGPGGVGKTRLALQAAAEVIDDFPDGVFFVPLAPLSDPELVAGTIATVLDVRAEPGRSLVDALTAYLSTRRVLLVLDNFEHVAEAAPTVAELLGAVERLSVLTTSRAPLHLRAEREYPVPPLGLPHRQPPPTMEQLSQFDSVRLFIERARAVKPDFAVDNENAPAISEICWRLDGLPLAIELAAARVKMLPPTSMLKRLERRLPMLMGGPRDLPARQQTLRNTIAWSHDLLSPTEQALFRRMAVFAGGCTFEAAETVANAAGAFDLFDGLDSLVDENLVRQAAGPDGDPRYYMLETIREFAWEQLNESGETQEAREAHAAWCLALVERWPVLTRYRFEEEQIELLEAEHDNLRAALTWFEEQQDWERALRLAAAMGAFWFGRAYLTEGLDWYQRLLAHRDEVPPTLVAESLRWAAGLALFRGELAFAETALADALGAVPDTREDAGRSWTLFLQGLLAELTGDDETAASRYHETVEMAQDYGDIAASTMALICLGDCAYRRGDLDQAAALTSEAAAIARREHLRFFLVFALTTAGYVALARDDLAGSIRVFDEALPHISRLSNTFYTADTIAGVASVALAAGQPERAARLLGAVDGICERTGLTVLGHDAQQRHTTALLRDALSAEAFAAAWEQGRAMRLEVAVAEAMTLPVLPDLPDIPDARPGTGPFGLTQREHEVLTLMCQHLTNKEIAEALFVGPRTIQTHTITIFTKLGVDNRRDAAALAARHGLA
jgi:predicted ATPase/class 3 adenylate cyclase/DNA-binding CsgD family transcriptional regulator